MRGVSSLQSGCSRYCTPCRAPGSVTEYVRIMTTSTKRIGRETLLNFSMPDFTPPATTPTQAPMNTRCISTGAQADETKGANRPLTSSGGVWTKVRQQDLTRYSTDQPPMTL